MPLELLAHRAAAIGSKDRRDVAHGEGQGRVLEAAGAQPTGHREVGLRKAVEAAGHLPLQIDATPQAVGPRPDSHRGGQATRLGREIESGDVAGELEGAGGLHELPREGRAIEGIARRPPAEDQRGARLRRGRSHVDAEMSHGDTLPRARIVDDDRRVVDPHGQRETSRAANEDVREIPPAIGRAYDVQRGALHAHGRDAHVARRQIRQRRRAGEVGLIDREQTPSLGIVDRGIGHLDPTDHEPFALDEARRAHPHLERRELALQPRLDPTTHLLAQPRGPEGHGDEHRRGCQRKRPADDGPQEVGERLHARRRPSGRASKGGVSPGWAAVAPGAGAGG